MKILIVEDEIRIAKLLERMVREIWAEKLTRLNHCNHLNDAEKFLAKHPVDLLFLDLNLNGQNGFDILKKLSARPFHTVIVSAYKEKAIEAFEYGVLDFIPKPFNRERLEKTFSRLIGHADQVKPMTRFISVKKSGRILPVPVKEIAFIQAKGHYTELNLQDNRKELSDKSLEKLEVLLPFQFLRVHRSYLVNLDMVLEIKKYPGSKYHLLLKNEAVLPIGRSKLKDLKKRMI